MMEFSKLNLVLELSPLQDIEYPEIPHLSVDMLTTTLSMQTW